MAYVRKTDTLVNDIRWKIRRMSDKAIEATGTDKLETGSPIHQELVETALTAAWSDAPDLRGKLPDAWLNKYKRFDLVFKRPDGTKVHADLYPSVDRFRIPGGDNTYLHTPLIVETSHCTPEALAWVQASSERKANREKVKSQFQNIEYQLMEYMDLHASLNTALKDMPELEMYVPEIYLDKFRAPSEPRKAKAKKVNSASELNIDVNALTSAAIAHRITSTN